MYVKLKPSLKTTSDIGTIRNKSNVQIKRNGRTLKVAYRNLNQSTKKKQNNYTVRNMEDKFKSIKTLVNDPSSIFQKSKFHAMKYKEIEYKKLFKYWCGYQNNTNMQKELTMFHDHLTNLRRNVYPFTLMDEKFNDTQNATLRPNTATNVQLIAKLNQQNYLRASSHSGVRRRFGPAMKLL